MRWLPTLSIRQSWIIAISVGGLLLMLMIAGLTALMINRQVNTVAHRALIYDVALEDRGDDLRVAVLDVRHYHRNLVFAGPSRGGIADFERVYQVLHEEIDKLEALVEDMGLADNEIPPPAELREMARIYYADFRPAIALYDTDHETFIQVSDEALVRLNELERATQTIDRLGEQRAAEALLNVTRASRTATIDLLAILGGLAVLGVGLAYLALHTANEVRRLYAEQQESAAQLARALQAKTDFLADASHELRTPLTILRGNAEVGLELARGGALRPIFEDIVKESARMSRLVEDLLLLARSDSNSLPLDIECVDARMLVNSLRKPAGVLVSRQGASIEFDIDLEGGQMLQADPVRIEQAILVLVDNAATYGASQEPLRLQARTQRDELTISVVDHGPGIAESDLPLIFERFYRVDKTRSRKHGGAGLGLSIARSIVEAHGGRIEIHSRLGEGTVMTVHLPLLADPFAGDALDGRTAPRQSANAPVR